MPRKTAKSFEANIAEIEAIIHSMESEEYTLEESIKKYKEGMALALECQNILKKAEQEVYIYDKECFKKSDGEELV